jgi:hypothetical protein
MSQTASKARSRTFFAGISLKELFSTSEEFHAFLIGFFEILCPWPPRHSINSINPINSEYHYYLGGRAMAVLAWLAIAKLIQVVFF